jgi:hypothetical protein
MERAAWQRLLFRILLVACGLALETFRPAEKAVLCNPNVPNLVQPKAATEAELALKFNIKPQGGAILESFERKYSPYSGWGDYPESTYLHPAIV